MRKLFTSMLQIIPVLGLNCILNSAGNRIVGAENRPLHKLDFTCSGALQTRSSSWCLSLTPGLGRAGIAAAIW